MHLSSNSRGNLLKGTSKQEDKLFFVKSGRILVRGQKGWGIEPITEVISAKLGQALGIDVAEQSLAVSRVERYGKSFNTLVNISPDFRAGKNLVYLQDLYSLGEIDTPYFEDLIRFGVDKEKLVKMLMLDLIVFNEDRHNGNVALLGKELSPIYDNGYSMLYDDICGMCGDFKRATKFCLCNAPIYRDSFYEAERLWKKYGKSEMLQINVTDIVNIICSVHNDYCRIIEMTEINNIQVPDLYWTQLIKFIEWRIQSLLNMLKEKDDV